MFSRLLKRKRKSNTRSSDSGRRLGFESLENRRVLAATNLGAITGAVFIDNDGNGVFTAGEQVANAQVQLYEDTNSNNSLDVGTDLLVTTDTTDADGQYDFTGLSDGNYFVLQPNQTPAGGVALPQQVSPRKTIDGDGTESIGIDSFTDDTAETVDEAPAGTPETSSFGTGSAIGGNREVTASWLSSTLGDVGRARVFTLGGFLFATPDQPVVADYTINWDAGAGGFASMDLTAGGGTGICLEAVDIDRDDPGSIVIRAYSGADVSEATFSSITPNSPQDLFATFDDFVGDADFQNITRIELAIEMELNGTNVVLDNVGVFASVVETCNFLNESPAPQINVEKLTNGNQADLASDADVPIVAPGSTVTWTYQVTNTGTVDIVTLDLEDDQLGAITVADRVSGDTNGDGLLNPAEVWTFRRTGIAITGFYNNVARAEGFATSGLSDVATDPSNYRGAAANIVIEKFTNGNQADLATDVDVPNINVNEAVTWTYQVTNNGSIELTNVQVTDSVEGVVSTITNMGNGDSILDVGEVWTYSQTGTAFAGAYENAGTVNATAVGLGTPVTATDLSHYFGVQSQIDIEKATNNIDADVVDTGPTVNVGDTVTFTYVVTNTGNTPISNVVVIDDAGTPGNATDDFSPTFTGGDTDGNTQLDTTEAWTYEATRVATLGAYRNVATVTGQGAAGDTLNATDPSNHRGEVAPQPITKRDLLASAF